MVRSTQIDNRKVLAIFDVDNTLIDLGGAIDFDALLVDAFRELGVGVPPLAERDRLWRAGKDHAVLLRSWGVLDPRAFWDIFDRLDFEARSVAIQAKKITLFPDCVPALWSLYTSGQVVLAVHTNTPIKLARYQLKHFDIAKYFDAVLALDIDGYDQSRAKPEPWGVHHLQATARDKHGEDLMKRTVLIGDSRIDMETARNAGIPGVLISREAARGMGEFEAVTSLDRITPSYLDDVIRRFDARC
nr:HAD hydrolase-like protein [Candidatus Sigynarchaeum springense]